MTEILIRHSIRAVLIILLQGLVFQRIQLGGASFNYFSMLVYPVIIILLPMRTSRLLLVFIGFVIGLAVDLFYGSPGVHASAAVFIAFVRPYLLQLLEPRGGYPVNTRLTNRDLGMNWFLSYSSIMLATYLFIYFCVEVFSFAYIGQIFLKTILSFALSYLVVLSYVLLFNPK